MNRKRIYSALTMIALLLAMAFVGLSQQNHVSAGPEVTGHPEGSDTRLIVTADDQIRRIVYFASASRTMAGANTPIASSNKCQMFGDLHKVEVRVAGTLTGTAPTLAFKWQNSIDSGATWTDVGSFTTINATVTPAVQAQTVADLVASTATAYGDCWRVTATFGGTGTVTANFSVTGLEK